VTGQGLTLDPRGLPREGTPVAVGVSGGADSFSLLHALYQPDLGRFRQTDLIGYRGSQHLCLR